MKRYAVIVCMFLMINACMKTEPVQSKVNVQELIEKNYTLDKPETICGSLTAQLAHAPWSKNDVQPPHLLIVKFSSGNEQEFSFGIDRSPDFLFRLDEVSMGEHHFYYAHSRLLAYSCENKQLSEVELIYPENYEAQDAQSGLITSLAKIDSNILKVEMVDVGTLEFLVTPSKIEQVQEP